MWRSRLLTVWGVVKQHPLQGGLVQRADGVRVVVGVVVAEARAGEGARRRRVQQGRLVVQRHAAALPHAVAEPGVRVQGRAQS